MTNLRGAVAHADVEIALREHRDRIRQLEANPSGVSEGDWQQLFPINAPAPGTVDASTLGYPDPPMGYRQTFDGYVHLRGRVLFKTEPPAGSRRTDGVIFTLPLEVTPTWIHWFVVDASGPVPLPGGITPEASHHAYVMISSGFGECYGFMAPGQGLGGGLMGSGASTVGWPYINNPAGDYVGIGSVLAPLEVVGGHVVASPPPPTLIHHCGEYADIELSVAPTTDATEITLGVRLQVAQVYAANGTLTQLPVPIADGYFRWGTPPILGTLPYPPGYLLHAQQGAGSTWRIYRADPLLSGGLGVVASFSGPGYVTGDWIGLRMQGLGTWTVLKNTTEIFAHQALDGADGSGPGAASYSMGRVGFGAKGPTGTPLIAEHLIQLPQCNGFSLDGIMFRLD